MKKLFCYMLLFAALFTMTTACSDDKDEEPEKKPGTEQPGDNSLKVKLSPEEFSTAVKGSNSFTLRLINELQVQNTNEESFICSPLSASYALGIAAQGADEQTVNEITNVLKLPTGDISKMNQFFTYLINKTAYRDKDVKVNIANAFFLDKGFANSFNSDFEKSLVQNYNAKVEILDFRDHNTLGYINNWCNEQTNGMIPRFLEKIGGQDYCYLLNAIYFKGIWTYPFDTKRTYSDWFRPENKAPVERQFMNKELKVPYTNTTSFQAFQLPYGNGDYSMTILLPGYSGIRGMLGNLNSSILDKIMADLEKKENKTELNLYMPKFNTTSDLDLHDLLKASGVPSLFTNHLPNVTDKKVQLTKMRQIVTINVNEKGTEASAITGGSATLGVKEIKMIKVDHPFLYLISEKETGAIFFAGIYCGD